MVIFAEAGEGISMPYAESLTGGGGRVSTSSGNAGGSLLGPQPPAETLEVLQRLLASTSSGNAGGSSEATGLNLQRKRWRFPGHL